jgi:hypothetical protein
MSAALEQAPAPARPSLKAIAARAWPLARSLTINLLGPWIVYIAAERVWPSPSLVPLLASMAVPALDLAVEFARRRAVDAIAVISLVQLLAALAISLFAHEPHAAMAGHALQPAALGLVFLISNLVGRPLIVLLARQTMAGDDPVRQAGFDRATGEPWPRRQFAKLSFAWALGLCAQSAVQLFALQRLSTSDYLLFANLFGWGLNGLMVWGSVRWGKGLERRYRAIRAAAAQGISGEVHR